MLHTGVDNFNLISKYLGSNSDIFYHCQIVQRNKDNIEKVKEGAKRYYLINSASHLNILKGEIINLCRYYNARAYINISPKSYLTLRNDLLRYIVDDLNRDFNPIKVINKLAGQQYSKHPKWLVDIDNIENESSIREYLEILYKSSKVISEYIEIPTIAGKHLLVSPFNYKSFTIKFPNIDVHKNSMGTLLYYENTK